MTDTTVSDAVCFPQDDGTGVADGSEDYDSAAFFALLSKHKGDDSYVGEDTAGAPTLQFSSIDTANETVDVNAGYAYIMEGSHSVQSGSQTSYDTTLPVSAPYVVILPTSETGLGLGTDTGNDLWLAVDPTANDSVYIRHGSGLSAPTDPSVKLGTVNTSDGSTTRPNDLAPATFATTTADDAVIGTIEDKSSGSRHDPDSLAGGGSLTHIATNTPSGVSETTFTSGIDATYARYVIEIVDLIPASDAICQLQVSNDGGATWQSGSSDYEWSVRHETASGATKTANGNPDSKIRVGWPTIDASGSGISSSVELSNPSDASYMQSIHIPHSVADDAVGPVAQGYGGGRYLTAEAIDGVRIFFDAANISDGIVSLYGVTK